MNTCFKKAGFEMKKITFGLLLLFLSIIFFTADFYHAKSDGRITVIGELNSQPNEISSDQDANIYSPLEKDTILTGNQILPKTNDTNHFFLFMIGLGILYLCFILSVNSLLGVVAKEKS